MFLCLGHVKLEKTAKCLRIAYVASGRLDAFWEYGEDTFNCIGAALLVTEAGGLATDVSGRPYGPASDSIIAAPSPVHRSLTAAFEAGAGSWQ
jgi:myo-inositol-1(or 4)-monophosphatase